MKPNRIVSREAWTAARKALLAREKEFTRARDALSEARRQLPWVKVDKDYVFEGPDGQETLSDLFAGRSQLIVYHFMFGPDWEEGCPSCSYLADHFDGAIVHLNHRDVSMAVVSRAPLDKLEGYRKRMGWAFKWLSSLGSDFNQDYHVSFAADDLAKGAVYYNYGTGGFPSEEAPGISVFHKDANGDIFHTYSAYARGLDMLIGAYNLLDLVPKGRDEAGLSFTMEWLRRHDQYED
ncbi:MAG: thioredoxin family protein [Alphaproteobacteria bacterium]|nr:thioredoxin family protein [Alphaproteobacteria bacterium]